ncbi:MAG: hypothetical protein K9K37_11370 [Desulfocapsa sp.]|nr:hypothetical protein [Desulfocapsa sp.]
MTHTVFAETFSPTDFTGTWYAHKVVSGDSPTDEPRWGYGVITFDSAGNYSVSGWISSGSVPVNPTGAMEISPTGIVTIANEPLIHGVMSEGKNMVVFTDGKSKGNGLTVMTKRTTSLPFTTSDLAGSWYGHHVVTGDISNGDDPRWGYGTITMTGSGSFTATWTSPTQTNEISSGAVQIDTNGILHIDNDILTHGVMSDDRKQLVFTDGSSGTDGNGLMVLIKRDPGNSFTTTDLQGKWCGNHIVSGDAPSDDPRWGYGSATIDGSGNFEATWTSPTQTDEVTQGTMQINSLGIIGIGNEPLIHGVMSDDTNQIVFTDGSSSSQGNALTFLTRCESPKTPTGALLILLNQ